MVLELKNKIMENNVIISFIGPFSQGIIEEIGNALREHLKKDKSLNSSSNSIFSVFIEQSQNIKNYERILKESDIEKVHSNSILLIGKEQNKYIICSGNIIKKEHISDLKYKLEEINSLDKSEIQKIYKKKLRESIISKTGGAGMGFLEMAKRSTSKFEYDFIQLENDYYYFVLIVRV